MTDCKLIYTTDLAMVSILVTRSLLQITQLTCTLKLDFLLHMYLLVNSGYLATSWSIITLNSDGGANGSLCIFSAWSLKVGNVQQPKVHMNYGKVCCDCHKSDTKKKINFGWFLRLPRMQTADLHFFSSCSEVNSKGYPEFDEPISARLQRYPLF